MKFSGSENLIWDHNFVSSYVSKLSFTLIVAKYFHKARCQIISVVDGFAQIL